MNRKVAHATLFFVFISVLQLGVQPHNFEHKYITNDDTMLIITTVSKNE